MYAISNGVEFYDLAFKKEVKASKTTHISTCITILSVAILAIISASCVMGYLEIGQAVENTTEIGENIKLQSLQNSFIHIPPIEAKWIFYLGLFPIASHIIIAISTYINSKTKRFDNRYIY